MADIVSYRTTACIRSVLSQLVHCTHESSQPPNHLCVLHTSKYMYQPRTMQSHNNKVSQPLNLLTLLESSDYWSAAVVYHNHNPSSINMSQITIMYVSHCTAGYPLAIGRIGFYLSIFVTTVQYFWCLNYSCTALGLGGRSPTR
jgi:hypothetical protein